MKTDVKKLGLFDESCNKLFQEIRHQNHESLHQKQGTEQSKQEYITPIDLRFYLNRKVIEQFLQQHNKKSEIQLDDKQFRKMLKETQAEKEEETIEMQQAFEALRPNGYQSTNNIDKNNQSEVNQENEEMAQAFEALIPQEEIKQTISIELIAEELMNNFGIELDVQKLIKDQQLKEMTFLEFKQFLNS